MDGKTQVAGMPGEATPPDISRTAPAKPSSTSVCHAARTGERAQAIGEDRAERRRPRPTRFRDSDWECFWASARRAFWAAGETGRLDTLP